MDVEESNLEERSIAEQTQPVPLLTATSRFDIYLSYLKVGAQTGSVHTMYALAQSCKNQAIRTKEPFKRLPDNPWDLLMSQPECVC